jgi:hypothetical protein
MLIIRDGYIPGKKAAGKEVRTSLKTLIFGIDFSFLQKSTR